MRKYGDGTVKHFLSNMPADTGISELDRLATSRCSIEQCFQECKSYLGMTHYETRSYPAWHRHMLFVMVAQLFVTVLRNDLDKRHVYITMPMAHYLIGTIVPVPIEREVRSMIIWYHKRHNATAFLSHSRKKSALACSL